MTSRLATHILASGPGQALPEASCPQHCQWRHQVSVQRKDSRERDLEGCILENEVRQDCIGVEWVERSAQEPSNRKEFLYSLSKHLLVIYQEADLILARVPALKGLSIQWDKQIHITMEGDKSHNGGRYYERCKNMLIYYSPHSSFLLFF